MAGGTGVWVGQGKAGPGLDEVAFLPRMLLARLGANTSPEDAPLGEIAGKVLSLLQERGAAFLTDLAVDTGLSPALVRESLWELARRRRVTNDLFDVVRRGEQPDALTTQRGPSMRSLRRSASQKPEGRWAALRWGHPTPEETAVAQCGLLLDRYGVVARELALMDDSLLPWRVLYEVFSKLELTGEVRRGYFVEGLTGAQFATPEATLALQDLHAPTSADAPLILLHSQDPANLYGSGAPFDIPLLDGGTRHLLRRPGNWLVLESGRPILLVEQQGRKLTALPTAAEKHVIAAAKLLPRMFEHQRSLVAKHKLTVEEWNGQPVTTTPGKVWLEAAGFVRDYQGMTLYASWT
jgi:ATP-dependent Lhr-like helicase